jgi:hypothetical protein
MSRFCGPPDSGNGGYVCGLTAGYLDGPAEVTLRKPPPLETPLNLEPDGDGSVRVRDGQTLIAEATSSPDGPALQLPAPVSVRQARSAGTRSHLRVHPGHHPFPTCFVCGPDRRPGDGLRILVGPVPGRELLADLWHPAAELSTTNGHVRPEFIWAALDCAGGIGAIGDAVTRGRGHDSKVRSQRPAPGSARPVQPCNRCGRRRVLLRNGGNRRGNGYRP